MLLNNRRPFLRKWAIQDVNYEILERNLSTYSGGRGPALLRKERFALAQVLRFQSIGRAENESEKHP
jgi:hypothetical protein